MKIKTLFSIFFLFLLVACISNNYQIKTENNVSAVQIDVGEPIQVSQKQNEQELQNIKLTDLTIKYVLDNSLIYENKIIELTGRIDQLGNQISIYDGTSRLWIRGFPDTSFLNVGNLIKVKGKLKIDVYGKVCPECYLKVSRYKAACKSCEFLGGECCDDEECIFLKENESPPQEYQYQIIYYNEKIYGTNCQNYCCIGKNIINGSGGTCTEKMGGGWDAIPYHPKCEFQRDILVDSFINNCYYRNSSLIFCKDADFIYEEKPYKDFLTYDIYFQQEWVDVLAEK